MTPAMVDSQSLTDDRSFEPLADYVIAATGLSYYRNRRNELANHVAGRLSRLGIADPLAYLHLLRNGDGGRGELDHLIEDLTIGETHFFRHSELFRALEETILPEAIERNREHRRLRIWSAGASIGAEAYSVSILLRHHLAHLTHGWDVTILGTDINRSFLCRAANAQFENWSLRGTAEDVRRDCFSRTGDVWTLKPQFLEGVSFQYHNLAEHPFPSMLHNLFAFDVILCRNVMIYFNPEVSRTIIDNMRRCLVDGGWLLVGHAEHNLDLFRAFHTVGFHGATAYRRTERHNGDLDGAPEAEPAGASTLVPAPPARRPPAEVRPPVTRPGGPVPRQRKAIPSPPIPERPVELATARSMADAGEIESAARLCEQLLTTHKMDPACHLYHALMLEQLGRHSVCEQSLRRAIYIDRGYVLAHYYLGVTLLRLNRRQESAKSLYNALDLLAAMDAERVIGDADGLTVAELSKLARMQLEAVQS